MDYIWNWLDFTINQPTNQPTNEPGSRDASHLKIIAVGNPGSGKSTYLNALAGEKLFKSGVNVGGGLTYELDVKKNTNGHFLDTPGLADKKLRKKAGEAISEGLRKDGGYKVIFFVTQQSGRVNAQDATTMKLVLEAAPEIGQNYGVVVNKVPKKLLKNKFNVYNERMTFFLTMFEGIPEEKRCVSDRLLFLPLRDELDEEDNVLVRADDLKSDKGASWKHFVNEVVPIIVIHKENVKDVNADGFEEMQEKLEDLAAQILRKDEAWKQERIELENKRNEDMQRLTEEMDKKMKEWQEEQRKEEARKEKERIEKEEKEKKEKEEKERKEKEEKERKEKEEKVRKEEKERKEKEEKERKEEEAREKELEKKKEKWQKSREVTIEKLKMLAAYIEAENTKKRWNIGSSVTGAVGSVCAITGGALSLTGVGGAVGVPLLVTGASIGGAGAVGKLGIMLKGALEKSVPFNDAIEAIDKDTQDQVENGGLTYLEDYNLVLAIKAFAKANVTEKSDGSTGELVARSGVNFAASNSKAIMTGMEVAAVTAKAISTATIVLGGVTLVWDVYNVVKDGMELSEVEVTPDNIRSLAQKMNEEILVVKVMLGLNRT